MRALVLSAHLLCAVGLPAMAQQGRDWRPGDRVVIGDWTDIRAVAAGPDQVFIVSADAILLYGPVTHRWQGPYEPPAAGALEQVSAGMIDPLDNSLWLATYDGWVHFQPELQWWEIGSAGGRVAEFAFDLSAPMDGLFLRTPGGWLRVPRGSAQAVPATAPRQPIRPATVEQALRANPSLRGAASAFLLDESLQSARLTSAARSFDNLGWYLGTDGVGAFFIADGTVVPQRLTFGLPGSVVGAIHAVPGGVWAMTERSSGRRAGLTFVAGELTEFRRYTGPPATGLPFATARRLIGVGSSLWAATEVGVMRFPSADPGDFELYAEAAGLPDRRIASLSSRRGVVVAATARGLASFADTSGAARLAPEYAGSVLAVLAGPDTTWVGTPSGPRAAVEGIGALIRPASLDASAGFSTPVYDLAWMVDTVVGVTRNEFLWKAPGEDRWVLGTPLSGVLGQLRRLVADGDGFWVAGDAGVAWTRLDGAPVRPLLVERDLPGLPLDLAVDAEFLWVATDRGLVRFRLSEVRP